MRKLLILAAIGTLCASAAEARLPRAGPGGPPQVPANCPLTVAFHSYAAGIDRRVFARIEARLRVDRRVSSVTRHPWGREGEVTLCVRVVRPRYLSGLATDLNEMIPRHPRGPIQVHVARRLPY